MCGSSKREIGIVGLSCKLVVQIGRVEGKRVYFLETRDSDDYLVETKTFSSMKKIAAEAAYQEGL